MRKREGKASARLPVPRAAAKLMRTAAAKAREVAHTNDVRRLSTLATELDDLRKIVGAVTGKRVDINRIAVPYVRAVVKGGRLLAAMAEDGERQTGGGSRSRGATVTPTLKELGFSKSRSSRWQLAGLLPDDALEELREGVFEKDDEIWGLAHVLRAAKAIELD